MNRPLTACLLLLFPLTSGCVSTNTTAGGTFTEPSFVNPYETCSQNLDITSINCKGPEGIVSFASENPPLDWQCGHRTELSSITYETWFSDDGEHGVLIEPAVENLTRTSYAGATFYDSQPSIRFKFQNQAYVHLEWTAEEPVGMIVRSFQYDVISNDTSIHSTPLVFLHEGSPWWTVKIANETHEFYFHPMRESRNEPPDWQYLPKSVASFDLGNQTYRIESRPTVLAILYLEPPERDIFGNPVSNC